MVGVATHDRFQLLGNPALAEVMVEAALNVATAPTSRVDDPMAPTTPSGPNAKSAQRLVTLPILVGIAMRTIPALSHIMLRWLLMVLPTPTSTQTPGPRTILQEISTNSRCMIPTVAMIKFLQPMCQVRTLLMLVILLSPPIPFILL
jgi:hypothetical protein